MNSKDVLFSHQTIYQYILTEKSVHNKLINMHINICLIPPSTGDRTVNPRMTGWTPDISRSVSHHNYKIKRSWREVQSHPAAIARHIPVEVKGSSDFTAAVHRFGYVPLNCCVTVCSTGGLGESYFWSDCVNYKKSFA